MPSSNATRNVRLAGVLLLALLCAACTRPDDSQHRQLHALGTLITLHYYGIDADRADAATAALERLYRRLGTDWYPWHAPGESGELMRINAALARGESIEVSAPMAALLQRAIELENRSGGLYNVALGGLTELWGFHEPWQAAWRPPAAVDIARHLQAAPAGAQLRWEGRRLASDNRQLMLDPGGIAKGALLAKSRQLLHARRIDNAIVDLGGDLTVLGSVHGRAAHIGIRDPAGGAPLGGIEAEAGESVVTSGNYERYFEFDGQRYAHIIDPRNGHPARGTASVTVIHEDPLLADAAATALLVAGAAGFADTCRLLGIDRAVLIGTGGDLRLTPAMRERVHWR